MKFIIFLIILATATAQAKNDIIFDGYYRLLASNKPIGYVILSYEYDNKKKHFISKSYIRGNAQAGNLVESLVAVADQQFKPISYQHTSKMNKKIKTIDAKFTKTKSGLKMSAVISDGKTNSQVARNIPKGVFLSTFQVFLMLQHGLTPGKKFSFKAISEEDAEVHSGQAYIKEQPGFEGKGILRVLNEFKGLKYISNLTKTGEILITESPVQKIQTQLVPTPVQATKGFAFDVSSIKLVFGQIPRGQHNVLAKRQAAKVRAASSPGSTGSNDTHKVAQ